MKLFAQLIKTAPLIFGILIFYLCTGIFAGIYHGFTGSFSSVRGTDPAAAAAANTAVTDTVVGEIHISDSSAGEEAALSDGSDGSGGTGSVDGSEGSDVPSVLTGEAGAEEGRHYYRFVTITRIQRLHLRNGPSLTDEIIGRLPKGTTGYIITPGTDWSYLRTDDGQTGYCFNGYLELTEIPPEEYPEELKSVTPPVEP